MKNKIAIDLNKVQDSLDARFKCELLQDNLLSIENKFGLPKHIYVNDKGEIWTSSADVLVDSKNVGDVVRTVRNLTASKQELVFKVSDLFKLVAPPDCSLPEPKLLEDEVFEVGNEVATDILEEPQILALGLSPEDKNEVVVMVFDFITDDKIQSFEEMESYLAPKLASFLSNTFENMKFVNIGNGLIEVFFDSKLASNVSKNEFSDFLKVAFQDVDFLNVYSDLVKDFCKKISSGLPDYFKIRNEVLSEVLEQING